MGCIPISPKKLSMHIPQFSSVQNPKCRPFKNCSVENGFSSSWIVVVPDMLDTTPQNHRSTIICQLYSHMFNAEPPQKMIVRVNPGLNRKRLLNWEGTIGRVPLKYQIMINANPGLINHGSLVRGYSPNSHNLILFPGTLPIQQPFGRLGFNPGLTL